MASSCKDPRLFDCKELLDWAELQAKIDERVCLVYPFDKKVPNKTKEWITTSENIKNYNLGSILKANENITVRGTLPARLIPIPKNWPPINDEEVLINPNKKNLKDRDEDSYPQKNKLEKIKLIENIYWRLESEK